MLTALIAVAGTLLGSLVTHWFQRSAAERTAQHAFLERLRQDRLNAYNDFASTAMDYRHHQNDRWHLIRNDPASDTSLRSAAYSKRAALRTELLRVRMLTDDARLHQLGAEAIEAIRDIHKAESPEAREELSVKATAVIESFVQHAATGVQALPTPPRARAIGRRDTGTPPS